MRKVSSVRIGAAQQGKHEGSSHLLLLYTFYTLICNSCILAFSGRRTGSLRAVGHRATTACQVACPPHVTYCAPWFVLGPMLRLLPCKPLRHSFWAPCMHASPSCLPSPQSNEELFSAFGLPSGPRRPAHTASSGLPREASPSGEAPRRRSAVPGHYDEDADDHEGGDGEQGLQDVEDVGGPSSSGLSASSSSAHSVADERLADELDVGAV